MRHWLLGGAAAIVLLGGSTGIAGAATSPKLHIKGHLRVDGSSDLRGVVRARSGLHVTAGLSTDSLSATGPVQIAGILAVSGAASVGSLNAGSGIIATTGSVQAGSLTTAGDINTGGNLSVSHALTANQVSVGAGGVQVTGGISAAGLTTTGDVRASGSIDAGTGSFTRLNVVSGGSINFNNATITGVSGLNLSGNATLSSLKISTVSAGGINGTQALTITQNGQTASLSVASGGLLTVGGSLSTPALSVINDATVGGTLTTGKIANSSQVAINTPKVVLSSTLEVSSGGIVQLDANGSNAAAHMMGNRDTRGQCTITAGGSGTETCGITFSRPYSTAPLVVVSPTGSDPSVVTGFAVQSGTTGFVITFNTSRAATVTFNYMVEG